MNFFVDTVAKATLLFLAAALAAGLLRRQSAALRHLVWVLAVGGALLLPVLSVLLPEWRVGWLPVDAARVAPLIVTSAPSDPGRPEQAVAAGGGTASAAAEPANGASTEPGLKSGSTVGSSLLALYRRITLAGWMGIIWLVGALLALAPLLAGWVQLLRITRRSRTRLDPAWQALLGDCAGQLGLRRPVAMYESAALNIPVTWGCWRPVLLLPPETRGWSYERRRMAVLHELGHVKRGDWLTQTLADVAAALYWFHPSAWFAARRMRVERELACDDLVLRAGMPALDYANELLKFAASPRMPGLVNWAAVPIARPSVALEGRVRAILEGNSNRAAVSGAALVSSLLLVSLLVVPLAMLRVLAEPAGHPALVFDKTYERELRSEDRRYLDLDTGNFVAGHPPGDVYWPMVESDLRVRAGREMAVIAVDATEWDASVEEVTRRLSAVAPQKQVRLGGQQITWFFKTREGSAGILQVRPHEQKGGVVKVRYKLVRPQRQFATTVTTLLPAAGARRYLNLDDGQLAAGMPTNSLVAYLEKDRASVWHLVVEGLHNYPTERDRGIELWKTRTAEEMAEPAGLAGLPFERKGRYALRAEALPVTVLVPAWGLVQVSEVDWRDPERPSVILQYKRLADGDKTGASVPATPIDRGIADYRSIPFTPQGRTPLDRSRQKLYRERKNEIARDARMVVDKWLALVGAEKTDEMWALTTRENGMDTGVRNLWEFNTIKAHRLLWRTNGQPALVTTTRFKDNSGRERVLQFQLVRRDGKWLIREEDQFTPEDAQRRMEGFQAHPGVVYDVRREDIIGDWTSGFLTRALHTLRPDGTGSVRDLNGKDDVTPSDFRWELEGDVFRRISAGNQVNEGRIVRLEDDLFAVRYANGNQWGYHRRRASGAE